MARAAHDRFGLTHGSSYSPYASFANSKSRCLSQCVITLLVLDCRERSDPQFLRTFLPSERLALADARRLNAIPRFRFAVLAMLVWSSPLLSSCHTEKAKASLLNHVLEQVGLERDILNLLNPKIRQAQCAFAIERSRGVIFASDVFSAQFRPGQLSG